MLNEAYDSRIELKRGDKLMLQDLMFQDRMLGKGASRGLGKLKLLDWSPLSLSMLPRGSTARW